MAHRVLVDSLQGEFDNSTGIFLDNPAFGAAFQQSSFSVWLKEPGKDGIVYEEGGNTHGYAMSLAKGEVQFATGSSSKQTTVTADYPDGGDWHFIATVFDRGTMQLYIYGELMDEELNVSGISSHINNMGIGAIRNQHSGGHGFIRG